MDEEAWHEVCRSEQLRRLPRRAVVDGHEVCVWRTPSGELAALADRCAHQEIRLSGGTVRDDGWLVCPAHGWDYPPGGAHGVPAHDVRELDGVVEVRLRSA